MALQIVDTQSHLLNQSGIKWKPSTFLRVLRMNLAGGGTKLYIASDQMTILIYLRKFLEESDNCSLEPYKPY